MLHRREDIEEVLVDSAYFQATFHELEQVKALYQAQEELGMANEAIARTSCIPCEGHHSEFILWV